MTPPPQLPIYLTTLNEADGVSYAQCIDPANWDMWTGEMQSSYCWRYACLPDGFSRSPFNATLSGVTRYNIATMPATSYQVGGCRVQVL